MSRQFDIIIVGAGASGLMAGIHAARAGAHVLILEHMDKAAKKILVTGNGKCNFTNEKQGIAYYHGKNPAFVLPALRQFGVSETLQFFEELGIYPKKKWDAYYYPASGQASSIAQSLLLECKRLNVRIACNIGIREIKQTAKGFSFHTKQGDFFSNCCIIATGGKAAKKTGSDGSGFLYIEKLGHKSTDIVPALVQLQGKQLFLKEIAGIRADGKVSIYIEKEKIAEDAGELQLTEFGISGIPTFQVSRYASFALSKGKHVFAMLDFLPELTVEETRDLMRKRFLCFAEGKNAAQALLGLFPDKLNAVLLKEAQIPIRKPAGECSPEDLARLAGKAKALRIDVTGTKGFDYAQVSAGGVDTSEVNPMTMESRLAPGLYFAGEVLDVDGMCGGYNLQWAWSSGYVAGKEAASCCTAGIHNERSLHDILERGE